MNPHKNVIAVMILYLDTRKNPSCINQRLGATFYLLKTR